MRQYTSLSKLKKTMRKSANEENPKYSTKEETNLTNSSVLHGGFLAGAFFKKKFLGRVINKGAPI